MSNRFLIVSDLHLGAEPAAFHLQPRHLELWPTLLAALTKLAGRHNVCRIIACGDLTHHGTAAEIAAVQRDLSSQPVPWVICLGNHDLSQPDSYPLWGVQDTVIQCGGWDLIIIHNAWFVRGVVGLYWQEINDWHEVILPEQLTWLANVLTAGAQRPAILVVHAPLDPVPARLSSGAEPLHQPHAAYAEQLNRLLDNYPRVKLVLSGHNHVHTATIHSGRIHLTTAALLEAPFELRLIECAERSVHVETVPVIPLPAGVQYDSARAWVNGQAVDRTIALAW